MFLTEKQIHLLAKVISRAPQYTPSTAAAWTDTEMIASDDTIDKERRYFKLTDLEKILNKLKIDAVAMEKDVSLVEKEYKLQATRVYPTPLTDDARENLRDVIGEFFENCSDDENVLANNAAPKLTWSKIIAEKALLAGYKVRHADLYKGAGTFVMEYFIERGCLTVRGIQERAGSEPHVKDYEKAWEDLNHPFYDKGWEIVNFDPTDC